MSVTTDLKTYKAAIAVRLAAISLQESTSLVDYDGHRASLLREMEAANELIAMEDSPYELVTEMER